MRDFVFIDDVVAVNLWFFDHPEQVRHLQPRHRQGPAFQ
jgi:nucleoside-diphosphate-sugar epimerase